MLSGPKLYPTGWALFIAVSERQARRRVSKTNGLPSGAVIVLVGGGGAAYYFLQGRRNRP